MRRLALMTIALLAGLAPASHASSVYVSPDVPTTIASSTYLPTQVIRDDSGVHSLELTLPAGAAIDAMHRRDDGRWLFSFDAPVQLSAVTYQPNDVVLYDGVSWSLYFYGAGMGVPANADIDGVFMEGGDNGNIVVSLDVPAVIRGLTFLPADLIRFTGPVPSHFLDSTATTPPIPISTNVTGADARGGLAILTFDVPTILGAATYVPGELVSWSGAAFASYRKDPLWPPGSRVDAFAFPADPGEVPTLDVALSTLTPGDLTISWTHSCSTGAGDYAIYEGSLGSWYSHKSIDCSDNGGDFVEEITPSAKDSYYLVVPFNSNDEGSYGARSNGIPRPPGSGTCVATQVVSQCP